MKAYWPWPPTSGPWTIRLPEKEPAFASHSKPAITGAASAEPVSAGGRILDDGYSDAHTRYFCTTCTTVPWDYPYQAHQLHLL